MPRLHLVSDLHIDKGTPAEAAYPHPAPPGTDVVVIAGDIRDGGKNPARGLQWARAHYGALPIVFIPGNHDVWGGRIPRVYEKLEEAGRALDIHVLERSVAIVHGVRFLGCTLWTSFALGGGMAGARAVMRDYKEIVTQPSHHRLRPEDTHRYHVRDLRWLTTQLADPFAGSTVVLTHHAPTPRAMWPAARAHPAAGADASDLEAFIATSGAHLWGFGHTHVRFDTRIGSTRVVSNARGYGFEPNPDFDPTLLLDV